MALNIVSSERLSTNVKTSNLGTELKGKVGKRKNIIINGDFRVAQRGTSSTSNGYQTVDRFLIFYDNTDEAPTQEQADVAAGTSPYTSGFRKCFKITNGNQTGGAGTSDVIVFSTKLEAQDIANSGWNYTSSSSFITLSFWVKSSVAQTFYGQLVTDDGTKQNYPFETGSLTADTWTKVTKTIPGNSNLTFNNDTGEGMEMIFTLFRGTDTTGSVSLNAWAANNNSVRMPNNTSTWYTTNNATFEITGIQLEVGSVATDFEHRSFAQELALCQRYYYEHANGSIDGSSGETSISESCTFYTSSALFASVFPPVTMRAKPTLEITTGSAYYIHFSNGSSNGTFSGTGVSLNSSTSRNNFAFSTNEGNGSGGHAGIWRTSNANAKIAFSAEV